MFVHYVIRMTHRQPSRINPFGWAVCTSRRRHGVSDVCRCSARRPPLMDGLSDASHHYGPLGALGPWAPYIPPIPRASYSPSCNPPFYAFRRLRPEIPHSFRSDLFLRSVTGEKQKGRFRHVWKIMPGFKSVFSFGFNFIPKFST